MFHPDNTHNYHPKGNKVSHSIYDLWNLHGGTKGLAVKLRTDPKVTNILSVLHFLTSFNIEWYKWDRN